METDDTGVHVDESESDQKVPKTEKKKKTNEKPKGKSYELPMKSSCTGN